jgi:hypothetical protein
VQYSVTSLCCHTKGDCDDDNDDDDDDEPTGAVSVSFPSGTSSPFFVGALVDSRASTKSLLLWVLLFDAADEARSSHDGTPPYGPVPHRAPNDTIKTDAQAHPSSSTMPTAHVRRADFIG